MRLPYLSTAPKEQTKVIGNFGGLNKGLVISENEFSDMTNMSSHRFPAIATRRHRGESIKTLSKPNGLFHKNGIVYVDGTALYYKDKKIADVADSKKQIVGLGAYIVVFPDKIMYNTSTGDLTNLEQTWTQSASATIAQTTTGSTLVKITCTGIGKSFAQYDGVELSGCTEETLNGSKVIQELSDDYIVIIGNVSSSITQSSGLKITRTVPDMDYVCESENRLWGCSSANHEIYASKLGDAANWQAFEGISTDSYAVTVGSDGDFTGCIAHLNSVLFFKEDTIHKVFGDKPSNYYVSTSTPMRGVATGLEDTMCIVNETLLYVSRDNVCTYDGAQPEAAGDAVKDMKFQTGVARQYDGRYYASLQDQDGAWGLYVYDLARQLWHREDDSHLLYMSYGEGELYCINDAGELFTICGEKDELIEWEITSGDLLEGTVDYKHVKKLQFHVQMEADAELNVWIRYDEEPSWEKVMTYKARERRTHTVNIIPHRCQKYQYRLQGFGTIALIALSKKIGQGSDIRGCI